MNKMNEKNIKNQPAEASRVIEFWIAWHIHPLGQNLIVTAGYDRVQRKSDPIEEIRPGDVYV